MRVVGRANLIRVLAAWVLALVFIALSPLDNQFGGEFTVRERFEGVGERRFILFSPEKTLANAVCRKDGDSQIFEVRDAAGSAYVISRLRKRPWGYELFVSDQAGKSLGSLKEKIQAGLLRERAIWEVRDGKGELLALTTPQDSLSTEWNVQDARDGNKLDLSRPGVSLSDYWKVKLSTKLTWDRRFVFALALYRVASDADRRSAK